MAEIFYTSNIGEETIAFAFTNFSKPDSKRTSIFELH